MTHPLVTGPHALGRRVVLLACRRAEPLRAPAHLALSPPGIALEIFRRTLEAIARLVQAFVDDVPRAVDGVGEHLSRTIHHFVVGHLFLLANPLDRLVQIASGLDSRPGIRFYDTRSSGVGQSPFPRC